MYRKSELGRRKWCRGWMRWDQEMPTSAELLIKDHSPWAMRGPPISNLWWSHNQRNEITHERSSEFSHWLVCLRLLAQRSNLKFGSVRISDGICRFRSSFRQVSSSVLCKFSTVQDCENTGIKIYLFQTGLRKRLDFSQGFAFYVLELPKNVRTSRFVEFAKKLEIISGF